jgi:LAO/AO transport system kinase
MKQRDPNPEDFAAEIRLGNRALLARAITFIESTQLRHNKLGQAVISALLSHHNAQESLRIGVTGAPGCGKSTFIEALGLQLANNGKKVAVLAIDPSSTVSKGSILGDKTRMEQLGLHENAFIRPSPAGNTLGGVARKTRETILLLEAAGFDIVFIETVGVGQSEIAVHGMTDIMLLLLNPGAGDDLQGIKRGIVEMADIIVVNKNDDDRAFQAKIAQAHYSNALQYFPPRQDFWNPSVLLCSALKNTGLADVLQNITEYTQNAKFHHAFLEKRQQQALSCFRESLRETILARFFNDAGVIIRLPELELMVSSGKVSPYEAAADLINNSE